MRVKVAKKTGYCYGVERAIKLACRAVKECPSPICTLGPIIHNPQVVKSLKSQGIHPVKSIDKIDKGTVIVRSHGVESKVIAEAKKKGLKVVDATCPFVRKVQKRVADLSREGYKVIIVGERNHPEVMAILASSDPGAVVVQDPRDLSKLSGLRKVGVVVQTTQSIENLTGVISKLLTFAVEVKIFNTICDATYKRQQEAEKLARKVDVMLVVGGKNSANTTRLAELCKRINKNTHHIETVAEVKSSWLSHDGVVGVTSGASTPDWILEEVIERLKSYPPAPRGRAGPSAISPMAGS